MTYLSGKSLVESFEQTVSADNLSSSQVLLLLTVERFTVFVPCPQHSLNRFFFLKFDIKAHKSIGEVSFVQFNSLRPPEIFSEKGRTKLDYG